MLLTDRKKDMERNLRELKKAMSNWGMKIHWGKTKVMMVSKPGEDCKVCGWGRDRTSAKHEILRSYPECR